MCALGKCWGPGPEVTSGTRALAVPLWPQAAEGGGPEARALTLGTGDPTRGSREARRQGASSCRQNPSRWVSRSPCAHPGLRVCARRGLSEALPPGSGLGRDGLSLVPAVTGRLEVTLRRFCWKRCDSPSPPLLGRP